MKATDFSMLIRDRANVVQGVVDEYQSLQMVLRFNALDSYVLTTVAGTRESSLLAAEGAGLIVSLYDEFLLSGPVYHPERSFAVDTSSQPGTTANLLIAAGPDDSVAIANRVVEPCDPDGGGQYVSQIYDTQTGAAETVMHYYVNRNAGPGARTPRITPGLVLAPSGGHGTSVTVNGRFDPLDQFISQIALTGGDLGWRVLQSGPDLVFSVYEPRDLSASAVFSVDLGNLASFDYGVDVAQANAIIAGGVGDGTARLFAEVNDSTSVAKWGRIEFFRNDSSASTPTILTQGAEADLAAKAEQTKLSMIPLDNPGLTFGKDYFLGDRVTVVIDGVPFSEIVREVAIDVQRDQPVTAVPLIGTPRTSTVSQFLRALAANSTRVGSLERI